MLGHDWQPAVGTVVGIRVELGYPGFHEDFKGPGLGETVQVKAGLKRKDARWDLSDPALSWKADRNRQAAQFKAEKERPA
jgi:hypothetical protein